MEESLTRAEQVRRQLKAGRKPKARELPTMLEAVYRLSNEMERARGLMAKYGLSPDDIGAALLVRAEVPGRPLIQRAVWKPGQLGVFIHGLEQLAALTRVEFVGIMWQQTDRDPKAKAPRFMWVTEFAADKSTALQLLAFKNELAQRER